MIAVFIIGMAILIGGLAYTIKVYRDMKAQIRKDECERAPLELPDDHDYWRIRYDKNKYDFFYNKKPLDK